MQLIICYFVHADANCQTNIDECGSNPCLFDGTCLDVINGYICSCRSDRAGLRCEVVSTCINNPCLNGAQCSDPPDGVGDPICDCILGFEGSLCEINVDECASNPCGQFGE